MSFRGLYSAFYNVHKALGRIKKKKKKKIRFKLVFKLVITRSAKMESFEGLDNPGGQ